MQALSTQALSQEKHTAYAKYTAEFIGTLFLVFTVGCNVHNGNVGAAISIGAMLMVMIFALGSVSGAHFNPAVTFAVLLSGRNKIRPFDAGMYMLVQIAGGVAGALMYWAVVDKAFLLRPIGLYTTMDVIALEVFYTWALCYVVLNVATTEKKLGNVPNYYFGLAIGMTVTAAAIAIGPITGCSLNPAVTVGAIIAAYFHHGQHAFDFWWPYILAPFAGAIIAFLFFYLVRRRYEYGGDEVLEKTVLIPDEKPQAPVMAEKPAAKPKPLPKLRATPHQLKKKGSVLLQSLGHEVENHDLVACLSWAASVSHGFAIGADVDASCVKYDADCRCQGAVYFADTEDKDNGIKFSGDELFGSIGDQKQPNETIRFKLSNVQDHIHYLFICATIFSTGVQSFKDISKFSVKLLDLSDSNKELLKFEKEEASNQGNALVIAMLFRNGKNEPWYFKALDECYPIQEHGTYRALEPQLMRFCQQTKEVFGTSQGEEV